MVANRSRRDFSTLVSQVIKTRETSKTTRIRTSIKQTLDITRMLRELK